MRWPQSWGPPHHRQFPHGVINCIVMDEPSPDITSAYAADGLAVTSLDHAGVTLVADCKWPQVQTGGSGDSADAGPTGVPWVDANGYAVQLMRALHPDRPVWLDYGPPHEPSVSTPNMYRLAICDAAAYGGHWVIRPDAENWPVLHKTLDFFAQRPAWQAYRPIAKLAVVSDFAGPNRALAVEALNLLTRRRLPYVVIPEARLLAAKLSGYAAILWIHQPGVSPVSGQLNAFARQGGLLLQPRSQDPFEVAVDTHMRMNRRNDMLRLWNDGSLNVHYTASPDGREHLLHLINYSAAIPSDAVTLGLAQSYKSALFSTLDDQPVDLPIHPVRAGIELQLPPFPVYAAISLKV